MVQVGTGRYRGTIVVQPEGRPVHLAVASVRSAKGIPIRFRVTLWDTEKTRRFRAGGGESEAELHEDVRRIVSMIGYALFVRKGEWLETEGIRLPQPHELLAEWDTLSRAEGTRDPRPDKGI